ncbi:hypothetical protein Pmar_PMAR021771 [Perkinsus marinus ATCC 50983]|uniref:Uncharacterized protein n=1 Tax=Perkinsus marinus (strain ATCC 50983 / TXsc) TaxID=423536 RepID=C5LG12_PERM5|nr:hypothetical protein Pmar_PMAR021771 [Perkinsus marinus ATCC 50983]EER04267.1 hypothetical protein Pmar_PMAR021771 [Perkinsus marinus ATCC 50983]|eukprot:XP_002772451.1 hypothetical protein Pmar_PMAR021771 [Perkinsus marinus ATCC 50983]
MRVWDLYANTKNAAEVRKSAASIHGAIEGVIDQHPDLAVTVGDSLLDGAARFDLIELQSVNREACYGELWCICFAPLIILIIVQPPIYQ